MKTLGKKSPFALAVTMALLLSGCASSTWQPDELKARLEQDIVGSQLGVAQDSIRGEIYVAPDQAVVVTTTELLFCSVNGFTIRLVPQLRLPLSAATDVTIVHDAGYMGKSSPGLKVTFNAPVQHSRFSRSENEIVFPTFTVGTVESGHITTVFQPADGPDEATAQAAHGIIAAVISNKSHADSPSATVEAKLKQLKELLDKGLIDKKTYDARSAELVKGI